MRSRCVPLHPTCLGNVVAAHTTRRPRPFWVKGSVRSIVACIFVLLPARQKSHKGGHCKWIGLANGNGPTPVQDASSHAPWERRATADAGRASRWVAVGSCGIMAIRQANLQPPTAIPQQGCVPHTCKHCSRQGLAGLQRSSGTYTATDELLSCDSSGKVALKEACCSALALVEAGLALGKSFSKLWLRE